MSENMGVTNNQPKPITRMTKEVKGILSNLMNEGVSYLLYRWENMGECSHDFDPSCKYCVELKELEEAYDRACEVERFITKKLNLEA